MLKLIREYFKTGIEAHKKQIETCNKGMSAYEASIQGWKLSCKNNDMGIAWNNYNAYVSQVNRNIRIERLSKLKRLTKDQQDQLRSDNIVHNYCEENGLNEQR